MEGLYNSEYEKDSCGIGFLANLKGRKSHNIVKDAITMLERMEHRGGTGFDECCGDGAGILVQIPHLFFNKECVKLNIALPEIGNYAVGMILFPNDEEMTIDAKYVLSSSLNELGLEVLGYRKVPIHDGNLGVDSLKSKPNIEQIFIKKPEFITDELSFERRLLVFRKFATRNVLSNVVGITDFSIISLSCRTIIYKGMLTTYQLKEFFPDLSDKSFISALALVHSRFSTNTFPNWRLSHPFRYIAHNGEINTIKGNINWLKSREQLIKDGVWTRNELDIILPIADPRDSDSSNLDKIIEFLYLSGRSLPEVIMMLIPEAWQHDDKMSDEKKAFYEYHACLMEPWDGPASICFTDGKIVGATLDRNGLRPSRYLLTKDNLVVMCSEAGALKIDPENVVFKERLQAGRMFIADLEKGKIIADEDIKNEIYNRKPYRKWLNENKITSLKIPPPQEEVALPSPFTLFKRQLAFGVNKEILQKVLAPMVEKGKEAIGSMGSDIPIAVLSNKSQKLSNYFRQLFAQVTNPPIDSIREKSIMALNTYVGGNEDILIETPLHCRKFELPNPFLTPLDVQRIRYVDHKGFYTKSIYMNFRSDGKPGRLENALDRICRYSIDAVNEGYSIINLTHRGFDSGHAPIPSLLAVGAVHHYLLRQQKRGKIDIIVEAGDIFDTHDFATLIGYGAAAISPFLAIESISSLKENGYIDTNKNHDELVSNYREAICSGLLKIISKMGISTIQSFQGAQIFEALGISKSVIDKYFTGTPTRIGGLGIEEIAIESLLKFKMAFPDTPFNQETLDIGGFYSWRRNGERHLFNPESISLLQESTRTKDYQKFKQFCKTIDSDPNNVYTIRGLLEIDLKNIKPISIDEVEPIEEITKRFATGAMSFGSISWEAHTTLAIAMNRIGGKSNSGEGGEDEIRYKPLENGDSMNSAIKQVASGRFGVTSYYLTNAKELQIKMAQGAKPGEGGQLPGFKVDEWIGRVRHSTPGVGLISPPPHHDIYSIEDLAQLVYDLKNANRSARINVKLVSEVGVGTVAAGVCKTKADVVLISGHDGGTGASPISSVHYAGLPWEIGVAETHQTLIKNKLRNRIVLQTDGQLRTPRDIMMAALLGAEEWGVATGALVVLGCIMMRKCHLNTCPVGVATQDKLLRQRFNGNADFVVNYFRFLAQGLREIMAELGFKNVNEMIGRSDLLRQKKSDNHWKRSKIDLSSLIYRQDIDQKMAYCSSSQNHNLEDKAIDLKLLPNLIDAIKNKKNIKLENEIENVNRAVGTIISNEISKLYQSQGLPDKTIHLKFKGSAGQSFGAFSTRGLFLEIEGETNDYCGKGMCGSEIVVYPDKKVTFQPKDNIIIGNVAFYGATSGNAYIRGKAGERFCVRNSGAEVVIEGVGDHGCEYMTGGRIIILGKTGKNFAAGMSGGIAYIYNTSEDFAGNCNMDDVGLEIPNENDFIFINEKLTNHFKYTNSDIAKFILDDFENNKKYFLKVMPNDYKLVLEKKLKLNLKE